MTKKMTNNETVKNCNSCANFIAHDICSGECYINVNLKPSRYVWANYHCNKWTQKKPNKIGEKNDKEYASWTTEEKRKYCRKERQEKVNQSAS